MFEIIQERNRLKRELAEAKKCQGCGSDLVCANADCRNYVAVEVLEDAEELGKRISVAVAEVQHGR